MKSKQPSLTRTLPLQFWSGLLLIGLFWPLNWFLPGMRTHILFFPLWLGYILVVDGLVWRRRGSSLLSRNFRAFVGLFVISAPAWWLFEVLNWRTQNWLYLGREQFSNLEFILLSSLSFSTVIPAVFGTAELVRTFAWVERLGRGPLIKPTLAVTVGFFVAGVVTLSLLLAWPRLFFPLLWLSVYFILEPINVWLGHRNLAEHTAVGDWRPIVSLWLGALICGFFWEMWNIYSYPKWIYQVAPFEFLYIFEMPLLGYGGYLPFALELFALYHLVIGRLGLPLRDYVQVDDRR
jgi:preprotein translocase subunit Sec61beta